MRPLLLPAAVLVTLTACGKPQPAETAPAAPSALAAPPLGADGVPRFRPGLWEVARTDDGETEIARECMGDEANAELRDLLTRQNPACKVHRSIGAAGLKVTADCDQAGVKTQFTFAMTGSDTAYDMRAGLYVLKPSGVREGGEMVAKARWIGACPAGVEPGQTVEP